MPSTITGYTSFTALTKIKSAKVNENFSNSRGNLIPIHETTATAGTTGVYTVGTNEYTWLGGYFNNLFLPEYDTTTSAPSPATNTSSIFTTGLGPYFKTVGGTVSSLIPSSFTSTALIFDSVSDYSTATGTGSTATRIILFTTSNTQAGAAIEYTSTAALGSSWVAQTSGTFHMALTYQNSLTDREFGITKNQTTLTNNITTVPSNEALIVGSGIASRRNSISMVAQLVSGDILRAGTDAGSDISAVTDDCRFIVKQIGL